MSRQNTIVLNVAAGETTPEIYGRIDLPAYQRSYQRVQNYEVLPQGALRFRNGTQHTHNTKSLGKGRLIPFTFNQVDTYMLEFTNKYLQFYRALQAVLSDTTFNIASITNANPGVITTAAPHGYSTGQEVFLSNIDGMIELNDQFFLIVVTGASTFTLTDLFGNAIDTTNFLPALAATGKVATAYGIATPYLAADLNQVHISQSGDTIILTHQDYMPYKLTRTALTAWSINFFTRTSDPFKQAQITAATQANPGVFTLANHGYKVGDTVYFDGWASGGGFWEALNQQPRTFTVNTVTTNTFTLKKNGVILDTSGFGAPGTFGTVVNTGNTPQTSAFLGMARLCYANTRNNPSGLVASELPDPTTGATKFDDFTPGANDNNAYYFTLAPVFNQQDAIQWIATNNQVIVLGCSGSVRQLTGSSGPTSPVTPSSIQANAISNIGAAAIQPYANGLTVYYVDQTTFRVSSFVFSIQVDNYVTVNQNLIANQLGTSPFILLAQQRRESGLLWVLRQDGVLAGMTFNEIESVYGWHRHYLGGSSVAGDGAQLRRANVLSIAVQPRLNADSILWMLVEREFASGKIYRSVEYWNEHIKFYDPYDFYSGGHSHDDEVNDTALFKNATFEQLKRSIHLDCTVTYDGTLRGVTANATLRLGVLAQAIWGSFTGTPATAKQFTTSLEAASVPITGDTNLQGFAVEQANDRVFYLTDDGTSPVIKTISISGAPGSGDAFAAPASVTLNGFYLDGTDYLLGVTPSNWLALKSTGDYIYTVCYDNTLPNPQFNIVKVRISDGVIVAHGAIPYGAAPGWGLHLFLSPAEDRVYFYFYDNGTVYALDAGDLSLINFALLGSGGNYSQIAVAPDGNHLVATYFSGSNIVGTYVMDTATFVVTPLVFTGAGNADISVGITWDVDSQHFYIVGQFLGDVSVNMHKIFLDGTVVQAWPITLSAAAHGVTTMRYDNGNNLIYIYDNGAVNGTGANVLIFNPADGSIAATIAEPTQLTPFLLDGSASGQPAIIASAPVFISSDKGARIWKKYDSTGIGGGVLGIVAFVSPTIVQVETLVELNDPDEPIAPGNWYITTRKVYGLLNFVGETLSIQSDGSPAEDQVVQADGAIALLEHNSVVHVGRKYLGLLASQNLDAGGEKGTAQGKIRKIRELVVRFLNSVACRVGTGLWSTVGLVFMEQDDLTDMPVPLYSDVLRIRPEDSWQRTKKQVVVMQDQPAPQTVLSVDVMVDTADD